MPCPLPVRVGGCKKLFQTLPTSARMFESEREQASEHAAATAMKSVLAEVEREARATFA